MTTQLDLFAVVDDSPVPPPELVHPLERVDKLNTDRLDHVELVVSALEKSRSEGARRLRAHYADELADLRAERDRAHAALVAGTRPLSNLSRAQFALMHAQAVHR